MMPTIIVDNVPADVYERLCQRAEAERRTVPEETVALLDQVLRPTSKPSPRLPDLIFSDETAAPIDLPRSSQPVAIPYRNGSPRLPDPLEASPAG